MNRVPEFHDQSRGLNWGIGLGTALLLVRLGCPPALAAASEAVEPKKVGLKESVKVQLVQLEVTVWPTKPDSDACLGLTADDFELLVDRKPQEIYAVDALGSEEETYTSGTLSAGQTPGGGLSIVLFFDLWHLDLFYRGFSDCPRTKHLAFLEARRFVREEFHDGDRLLLVTAAGWPIVHYGWIRTQGDALKALERLENNQQVMCPARNTCIISGGSLGWRVCSWRSAGIRGGRM